MKNNIIFVIFILNFSFSTLYAQTDFREGYVITNQNDTLYGLLDFRGGLKNSKLCFFKSDEQSKPEKYMPEEIKAYRFLNNKYYVSKIIDIEGKQTPLFLEFLINGIVDIYYYRSQDNDHYFVDNGDGNLYELRNEEVEIIKDDIRYFKESKEYVGTLRYAFRESPTISNKVDYLELSHRSLINITKDYHNEVCKDEECVIYEKKIRKKTVEFGILIGAGLQKNIMLTENAGQNLYYINNMKYKTAVFPALGFYLGSDFLFHSERWTVRYEFLYLRKEITANSLYFEPVYSMNYDNEITMAQNALNLSLVNRYKFPEAKIRPIFQAGLFFEYFFIRDYERILNIYFYNGNLYFSGISNKHSFPSYVIGLIIGTGFSFDVYNEKEASVMLNYHGGISIGYANILSNIFTLSVSIPIL